MKRATSLAGVMMLTASAGSSFADAQITGTATPRSAATPASPKATAKKKEDGTALMTAISGGQTDRVKALIASGVDVNAKDSKGMTALVLAIFTDNANCVEALLAAHADVNEREYLGNTPLITATRMGNPSFIKALIAAKPGVNAKNNDGLTALMYAKDASTTTTLIAAGADVNAKDNNGATAALGASLASDAARLKALIAAGANVSAKDNTGWAPLRGAANKGCADCVKALLAVPGSGSVVNAKDVSGNTALIYAAHTGDLESVKALIAAGAEINAKNNDGTTALGAAQGESVAAVLRAGQGKDSSAPSPKPAGTQADGTHVVTVGGGGQDTAADTEWQGIADSLAPGPFRTFLTKYPSYRGADEKKLYLSLEEQMADIRAKKSRPVFSIPWGALPPQWAGWRKNYYYLSVITIRSDGGMGIGGGFSGRFDADGKYTLPTKNGSILVFEPRSSDAEWSAVAKVLFNGITVKAKGMEKLYFGVVEEYGIVYLRGGGTAKMPDGKLVDLKYEILYTKGWGRRFRAL